MGYVLLLWLAVVLAGFSLPSVGFIEKHLHDSSSHIPPIHTPLNEVEAMLRQEGGGDLSEQVINKVLTTLKCANVYNVGRNNILTIIDYSLPSSQKRLWVFNLQEKKLLFHTYVSHGIKSGTLATNFFSNKYNSKASSIGVYRTEKAYYGREGLSLRLEGLDRNFNDNASSRSIVMHGGWYVDEQFIKRYGRPGRSWGCPALPLDLYQPIINTIKDSSFFVVYYPSDEWFNRSKFLNCDKIASATPLTAMPTSSDEPPREDVLFLDVRKNNTHQEQDPILVMAADSYETFFHSSAPLERMLRRQINNREYVALSTLEFDRLVGQNNQEGLNALNFVIPELKMVRGGYYETQMKLVNLGKIKNVQPVNTANFSDPSKAYIVNFEGQSMVNLKPTNHFIRWVGL